MLKIDSIINSPDLPSLPTVAVELLKLLRDPDCEVKDIIKLVNTDPAMSVRILKAANSSYFGFSSHVTSITRAVPLLGTTVVTSLALSFSLADDSMTSGPLGEHYRDYWQQSIVQASACEILGREFQAGLDSEYFLAGLLMDIGRLAILKTSPREYYPVLSAAQQQKLNLCDVELDMLGITHAEITSLMMSMWNLPREFIAGAKLHHAPITQIMQLLDQQNPRVEVAMCISSLVGEYFCTQSQGDTWQKLQTLVEYFYGWNDDRLRLFLAEVEPKIVMAGQFLSIDTREVPSLQDLMLEANRQLVHLTMMAHVNSTQMEARKLIEEGKRQQLEQNQEQLKNEAKTDALTKINNRRYFDEVYAQELEKSQKSAKPIGVIFMDIDRFKQLNDNYGHPFGDQVLVKVSDVIRKIIRSTDVLARYGGEEFVVLVNQPSEKALEKLAERIRLAIENEMIFFDQYRVPVTVSMGACVALPGKDEDISAKLIAEADEAMYASKKNGRNQIHLRSIIDPNERILLSKMNQVRFSRWMVASNLIDVTGASQALSQYSYSHQRIGDLARKHKLLSPEQIQTIAESSERLTKRFGQIAIEMGLLSIDQVASLLALQAEHPETLAKVLLRLGMLKDDNLTQLVDKYYEFALTPDLQLTH